MFVERGPGRLFPKEHEAPEEIEARNKSRYARDSEKRRRTHREVEKFLAYLRTKDFTHLPDERAF